MIEAFFDYQFVRYAVIAGFFAAILAGIIGVTINEKKMGIMAGGIAHASYGGIGLAFLINIEPFIGALVFAVITALSVGHIKNSMTAMKDILISMFWSVGMALGVIFIALKPGYPPNITSYLFGNILAVTTTDLIFIGIVSIVIFLFTIAYFQEIKAHLFDRELLVIKQRNIHFQEQLTMLFTAFAVVALSRVVGIILVIALVSIPAATSGLFTKNLRNRMVFASVFTFISMLMGLTISYYSDLPSGASIVVFSFIAYLIARVIKSKSVKKA